MINESGKDNYIVNLVEFCQTFRRSSKAFVEAVKSIINSGEEGFEPSETK